MWSDGKFRQQELDTLPPQYIAEASSREAILSATHDGEGEGEEEGEEDNWTETGLIYTYIYIYMCVCVWI